MRRWRASLPVLAALALLPGRARAGGSLGGDWTTGTGYYGLGIRGSIDLDSKGTWDLAGGYNYAHSWQNTESRSYQVNAIIDHDLDDRWDGRFGMVGWRDTLNAVEYLGPTFGFSYTPKDDDGNERMMASYDNDLFVYRAEESTTPRSITERVNGIKQTVVIPAQQGNATLLQWHPSFQVEKPLWNKRVTPWVQLGHYFYSRSPSIIEQRAGRPAFSSSASSLNGLVGGMIENASLVGLNLRITQDLRLSGWFGVQQLATDNSWATTQGVGLNDFFFDHVTANLRWTRSIQDGAAQDLYTAGGGWLF